MIDLADMQKRSRNLARQVWRKVRPGENSGGSRWPALSDEEIHREMADTTWLFIATLPNSGSTVLGSLLASSPVATGLQARFEGQWLIPALCAPGERWRPDLPVDYDNVRRVWTAKAIAQRKGPRVVIEKSPASLCRFRDLVGAFGDWHTYRLGLTRDPYAVCASWAKRHTPDELVHDWFPPGSPTLTGEKEYFHTLGALCGHRMQMMSALDDFLDLTVRYEDITENSRDTTKQIIDLIPELVSIDPDTRFAVKDYKPSSVSNLNAKQIASLDPDHRRWIAAGLAPYETAIEALGYTL